MTHHRAYWQDKAGIPGSIRDITTPTSVEEDEILIKVHAWSINPADHMVQDIHLPFIKYPIILGEDVAGTVNLVGSAATGAFKPGDRVAGFALGATNPKPEHGAFQEYAVLKTRLAFKIPDALSFADAASFPLCISTAALGLFSPQYLGLPLPKLQPMDHGKTVVVWGGSSAVGANAIQLCKASGLTVITTCSGHNVDLVKRLGADYVFDRTSPCVLSDLVAAMDKEQCIGIYHAAGPSDPSVEIAGKSVQHPPVVSTNAVDEAKVPAGVTAKWAFSSGGADDGFDASKCALDFLSEALAAGTYKVAPLLESWRGED